MILVTGASGFIGRALVKALKAQGHRVRALMRNLVPGPWDEVALVDLAQPDFNATSAMRDVSTVFHLAGIAHSYGIPPQHYQRVNVAGTQRLLHAAQQAEVETFVFFSSVKAAAEPPPERCVDEGWTLWPTEPYGYSKRMAEEHVLQAGQQSTMHVTVLRPTLVYGPGVKGNLQRFISLVQRGWMPPVPPVRNRRSYIHVQDLVLAALTVARTKSTRGKVYIVAETEPYSTYEIYHGILQALGRARPRWALPYPVWLGLAKIGDLLEMVLRRPLPWNSQAARRFFGSACYISAKLQNETPWRPTRTLLSSLEEVIKGDDHEKRSII